MKIRKRSGQYYDDEQARDEFGRFKKVQEPESSKPVEPLPELTALLASYEGTKLEAIELDLKPFEVDLERFKFEPIEAIDLDLFK